MFRKLLLMALVFALSACQAGAFAPTATSTLTPAFTPTPEPAPEFTALQEKIAQSDSYILMPDGSLEYQSKDGVVVIPDITVNPQTGEMTLTQNDQTFAVDEESIAINEDGSITFQTEDGQKWFLSGGEDGDRAYTLHVDPIDLEINQNLTPEEIKILESADPAEFPVIVNEDSQPAQIGIPIGAMLTVRDSILVYVVTNPAGQEVVVGQAPNGRIEKADAILYRLSATPEEAEAGLNKLPWDFVARGGANQIAKLNGEPFPEGVITGQDVALFKGEGESSFLSYLLWSHEADKIFEENPDKLPVRLRGYFVAEYTDPATGVSKDVLGKVYQWKNPDGTLRYLTYIYWPSSFVMVDDAASYFPTGFYTYGEGVNPPFTDIARDQYTDPLLQQWADKDSVPEELENVVVVGQTRKPDVVGK